SQSQESRKGECQTSTGFLRDSPDPFCALLCSTIATAVQPTGLDQSVANAIRQLQNRLSTETRNCPAGSPLQGECRRFEPVSTHHLNKWAYEGHNGPRVCRHATACSGFTFGFACCRTSHRSY